MGKKIGRTLMEAVYIYLPCGDTTVEVEPVYVDVDDVDGKPVYFLHYEREGKMYHVPIPVTEEVRREYRSQYRGYTFCDYLMYEIIRDYSAEEEA